MKPSTILFLIVILVIVAATAIIGNQAYVTMKAKAVTAEVKVPIIPVHVVTVEPSSLKDVVYVTGAVEAWERVDCIAKIPYPGKLLEVLVAEGDLVAKDQVLVTVDRDEVGAVYKPYQVETPIAGVVAYVQDALGSVVSAQQPVATILNTAKVKVVSSIIESDLGRVNQGDFANVKVDAYPDRVFNGVITKIEPVLDSMAHTAKLEILIDNADGALKPAMFARIEIVADEKKDVLTLPKNVLLKKQGRDLAYVVKPDEKNPEQLRIYLTEVELGFQDLDRYEIKSGLDQGSLVVDQDIVVMKDRTLVKLKNPPPGWEKFEWKEK